MLSEDLAQELIKEFGQQSRWAGAEERFAERPERDHLWWNDLWTPNERERDMGAHETILLSYLDFGNVARDDSDSCGQAHTWVRSNLRAIKAAYPNTFTSLHYIGSESLGAFLADIDDDIASMLLGLAHQYPLFDESDVSALEDEDIEESFNSWAKQELYGRMSDRVQDEWFAIGDERVTELVWSLVHAAKEGKVKSIGYGSGDECVRHDGLEVSWDWEPMIKPLASAISHRAHKLRKRGLIPA